MFAHAVEVEFAREREADGDLTRGVVLIISPRPDLTRGVGERQPSQRQEEGSGSHGAGKERGGKKRKRRSGG